MGNANPGSQIISYALGQIAVRRNQWPAVCHLSAMSYPLSALPSSNQGIFERLIEPSTRKANELNEPLFRLGRQIGGAMGREGICQKPLNFEIQDGVLQ